MSNFDSVPELIALWQHRADGLNEDDPAQRAIGLCAWELQERMRRIVMRLDYHAYVPTMLRAQRMIEYRKVVQLLGQSA